MANVTYDKELTALIVIDSYNDIARATMRRPTASLSCDCEVCFS